MTDVVDTTPHPETTALPLVDGEPVELDLDVAALGERLLGRWADDRRASRELMARDEFHRIPGLGMEEHRARVLDQLHRMVEEKAVHRAFPKRFGGQESPGGNLAAFEEVALADPSLQIKSGVQWGLFAAAIMQLGTESHHEKYLPPAMSLELPGAFAMTETGHGSDVASIGTTATYDPETDEFVIHTPFRAAWKDYLGNAALHGRAAVVFAQLITQGVNHGVHAFFVPIRDENGAFLPGVGGEDDGLKGGLNGIDNGRLHFDHVRVPRTDLLDRYGSVEKGGAYSSPIDSPGRRFFTMIGTLVQGRVSLDGAATVMSKAGLAIAIRYASERRQFSDGAGDGETVLLDYQRHQRRLLPALATTYAMSFAHEKLLEQYDGVFSGAHDTDADRQELETLAAALKPFSTWAGLDILQECREACGGAGYLAANRIVQLRPDLDIYATFEGDNNVLLQLVGKRLLSDYARRFKNPDAGAIAGLVAQQVGEVALNRSGLRALGQKVADFGSTARSVGFVRGTDAQRQLLTDRVETMVAELAGRFRDVAKLAPEAAAELFNANQNELIQAAYAHAELLEWEAFTERVEAETHEGTKRVLTWLRDLFGFTLIEKHLAWYLIHGRLSGPRAQAITDYIDDRLLPRLRPYAVDLIDAFGFRPEHLRADIASGAEKARQEESRAYYVAQKAADEAPVMEKSGSKTSRKAATSEAAQPSAKG
ncbi:MAG: acyl-CoA dehydrogenase family protein [Actinomycetales bacterium]|nr:acyl-CoA dehydrogenase family protein [Actinomycetales bacterium]